ncbi:UDP-3-O-(3-hydroxymyristoyl)glucosamine N-acyltransferase [Elioraea sp.]|uniref:UDP-3-O-(3-hydroxymyristoyl)glucosamine N-acyltransferase n=1 Tax=Elioraea sp. TaxID=2185103 RepID=UPI0021DDCE9F|nr:UDP-3-O-(3-hydroxymyristoyl)glucosamine N-acyltransferase [Elioraea sp.]GIX11684.1 MAG: UDP-3-O-acylglucosamine N-acyltransferase [Elioraea sp.]
MTGDPRFFPGAGPFPLARLAEAAQARLGEGADPARPIAGIAPLQAAGPDRIAFLDNRRYLPALRRSRAGACILAPALAAEAPPGTALLLTERPYLAWARVAALFHPPPPVRPGIHPSATVATEAILGAGVAVGPGAIIGARAVIGAGSVIGPLAVVGEGVVLGRDCRIGAGAVLSHCIAGDRVVLHPGAKVGQEGFGFAEGPGGFVAVPQLGRVLIGDDVEIGANSTIDRGSAADTVVASGTRMDNLVQIGHNVRLGRCCVVVAQSGISGSTTLGDGVVVAAQAGVTGHLRIGRQARIGAQAGVMEDVPARTDVLGSPARPAREFWRAVATLYRAAREGRRRAE